MTEPWFRAAEMGRVKEILAMLGSGANVNARDEGGRTALMLAAGARHLESARVLIAHGADLNATDRVTRTAMTYAVSRPSPRFRTCRPPAAGSPDLLNLLKEAGGKIGMRETVILGDVELARSLCDAGADPSGDARWFYHDTFLMVAVDLGHLDVVRLLLDRGAKIEGNDDLGARALMRAALLGHIDIVTLLLDRGADIDGDDWSDQTALTEAATHGHQAIVDLLLSRGAKHGLLDAVALDDIPLVESLLRDGADPNHVYYGSGRLVMYAVSRGNASIVRLLMEHNADHHHDLYDEHPLLTEAARHGYLDVVRLLIEYGADPREVGEDGKTALAWAAEEGHVEIVGFLESSERGAMFRPPPGLIPEV